MVLKKKKKGNITKKMTKESNSGRYNDSNRNGAMNLHDSVNNYN